MASLSLLAGRTVCIRMLGSFACLDCFKILKYEFSNTIRMPNNLLPDQDRLFVGTDHGSNYLHVARSYQTRSSVDWVDPTGFGCCPF